MHEPVFYSEGFHCQFGPRAQLAAKQKTCRTAKTKGSGSDPRNNCAGLSDRPRGEVAHRLDSSRGRDAFDPAGCSRASFAQLVGGGDGPILTSTWPLGDTAVYDEFSRCNEGLLGRYIR